MLLSTEEIKAKTLDDLLGEAEVKVSKLGQGRADLALRLLFLLDEISLRLQRAVEQNRPALADQAQFNFVCATLDSSLRDLLRDLGGVDALVKHRQQVSPAPEQWWWFAEKRLAEKVKQSVRRSLISLGISAAVVILLVVVYQLFLAPDPATQARLNFQGNAEQLIGKGEWETSLAEVEKGLAIAPKDVYLLTMKGIILEKLSRKTEADLVYAEAETLSGNRVDFLNNRAMINLRSGNPQATLVDGQEALKINPESAEAAYFVGLAYENMADYQKALLAYQKASALADAQNRGELSATIRINMAMLQQSVLSGLPTPAGLSTPGK